MLNLLVHSAPKPYLQFVGGKACKSESGCSVAVQSPDGAKVLAYCPDGGRKDVRNAVEAATKVQPGSGPLPHKSHKQWKTNKPHCAKAV